MPNQRLPLLDTAHTAIELIVKAALTMGINVPMQDLAPKFADDPEILFASCVVMIYFLS
jgi:hypothetical protein